VDHVVFETWGRLAALGLALVLAYVWFVGVLRISGKRTLSKLNAFDFIVTIALGSTLATVILSREIPMVEGMVALVGLVLLQYAVARATRRWSSFDRLVKDQPTALVVDGEIRQDAMARCRVRRDEVAAELRKKGIGSFQQVDVVVLETDGTFSVLEDAEDGSALDGVEGIAGGSDRRRGRWEVPPS
jgi:uncharacterized membrane protein YcaP (DUF421 family)